MLSLFLGLTLTFSNTINGVTPTTVSTPQSPRATASVNATGVATTAKDASVRAEAPAKSDQDYTLAYKRSVEEEKPLMVVVGAEYCPACEVLKKTTIANMEMTGELDQVSVAVVDRDAQPELAEQLMADEQMIPQIILFTKTADGQWNRRKLMGYQPIQPVRSLIRRAASQFGRG